MYKVISGKTEIKCANLSAAKKQAKRFLFAQIIDQFNFVRFIVRDAKIFKAM